MPDMPWTLRAAFAVTASGLALTGCSSGSSTDTATPTAEVTVTETAAASPAESAAATPAETTAETQAAAGLPAAPAGAKEVDEENESGMQYARYKVEGTSAKAIVDDYESELKSSGYTIENSGGSGGGWGKWGGSGYGMDAEKDGTYVSVQAGGSSGGPTYYEVCVGSDKSVVDQCSNESSDDENDSNSKGS